MNTRKYSLVGLTLVSAILAIVLALGLISARATVASVAGPEGAPDITSEASLPGVTVSGLVYPPGGSANLPLPEGTWVWLMMPDEWPPIAPDPVVHGRSQVVTSTGEFSFPNVPPGNYLIRAVPPFDQPSFTPSFIRSVVVFNTPVNVGVLNLTRPTITGTVYPPPPGTILFPGKATVHVYAGPMLVELRETLPNGNFTVGGLPTGTYSLIAEPQLDDWFWWSQKVTGTVAINQTDYVTLTLQRPQVRGIVQDSDLGRVADAQVNVVSLVAPVRHTDETGLLGRFAVGGLPDGNALIRVEPPFYRGGLLPLTQTVTLPHPLPITLTLQSSPKIVSGTVTTNVGTPVRNALIVANRVGAYGADSTRSDVSGHYQLNLSPGLWALTVKPTNASLPGHWIYPLPPQLLQFDDNLTPEVKRLDFKVLTADATVIGLVEMPGGGAPPFTVTVGLHTDQGIGVKQDVDAGGRFTFTVPHGPYQVDVRVFHPHFAAPPVEPILATPITPTVAPTITLIARDAVITGTLTVTGTSTPIEGVPVVVWNPAAQAAFHTRSGPDGVYVAMVYSGTWLVRPAPLPDQPYLYTDKPTEVTLVTSQTVPNVNFSLLYADAVIHGVLLSPDGNVADDARGWGQAVSASNPAIRSGAPVQNGTFDILVPGGATYSVTARLADGSRYIYTGDPMPATPPLNGTVILTFPLAVKDTRFVGALWDRRADMAVPGVPGRVWAWSDDIRLSTDIKTGNGTFVLDVPAGVWGLDYSIPEDSDYVKLRPAERYYALDPVHNPVQPVSLPVAKKNGVLTGAVLLPNGAPAIGATAIADGVTPDIRGLTLRAPVGIDGTFSMNLPAGKYIVRATGYKNERLINPVEKPVFIPPIPPGAPVSVTLQYQQPDARITGQVTLTGTSSLMGPVTLFAWTSHGGYNKTMAPLGGVYVMPVISNTLWHLVAVYETNDQYWKARALVPVATLPVTRNLVLDGPYTKPGPVSVLFDPTQEQDIELADGTRIHIPAGAMPVDSGNVLLNITPLAGAPHHQDGDVLGLTYTFEAFTEDGQSITDNFNQDVTIVFKYNPLALLEMGLDINHLRPAYFSTTTDSWTIPDSFVIDEIHREISMQINHFTKMGVLGTEDAYEVSLPVVLR